MRWIDAAQPPARGHSTGAGPEKGKRMSDYLDLRITATCRCRACDGDGLFCDQCHGTGRETVKLTVEELRELLTPKVPAGEKT